MGYTYNYNDIRQALSAKNNKYPINQLDGVALKLYETRTIKELKHLLKESKNERKG